MTKQAKINELLDERAKLAVRLDRAEALVERLADEADRLNRRLRSLCMR